MRKCLIPIRDRLVVKPDPREEKTASGILIPDGAKKRPQRGIVVAVGTGKTLESGRIFQIPIKPNYAVWYTAFAGFDVKFEGEDLLVMNVDDVLAVEGVEGENTVAPPKPCPK